jgi:2-succinyl-6-hydroxy-2,4-cyclohexadiene-1-carboxylate synthase
MKLYVDGIGYNVLIKESELGSPKIPILFLHGFTGCTGDWNFIFDKLPGDFLPFAIDLIGHGESDSPDNPQNYTCSAIVKAIDVLTEELSFNYFIIAGYSMGGRTALSYSLKNQHKIRAAIFESATPGIESIQEKKERVEHDFLLADKIKSDGVESFMEFWLNLPMFNTLTESHNLDDLRTSRYKNSVTGLSNSLVGFSTGLMNSYWDRLHELAFPTLLISGSSDEKFTAINKRMANLLPNARHKIIDGAGHNTHLEKPDVFVNLVMDFLNALER